MPSVPVAGVQLAYTRQGSGVPVVLITGLSGRGREWGPQVELFAEDFDVIVPDHPGCGDSSPPEETTLSHHTEAIAALLRHLEVGPAHIVGSSTGGAIAQLLGLDHPDVVRSISLVSSWARPDDFFRHQFAARREVLERLGSGSYATVSALFLFSPEFFRDHYAEVERWHEAASLGDPKVMADRIDMILQHDTLDRLSQIDTTHPGAGGLGRQLHSSPSVPGAGRGDTGSDERGDGRGASHLQGVGDRIPSHRQRVPEPPLAVS